MVLKTVGMTDMAPEVEPTSSATGAEVQAPRGC